MPQQVLTETENNFTRGLITEATGMNFPENACTSTQNCVFTLIGDVSRRVGFDFETNFSYNTVVNNSPAISSFKWDNVGGDGQTQIVVTQIGTTLYFYQSNTATTSAPLSTNLLASTVILSQFVASSGTFDPTLECQYAYGNGYLFVFHPSMDPIYCSYTNGVIAANIITVQIRDFTGLPETNILSTTRPLGLTSYHQYNLVNQGWASSPTWNFNSHSNISVSVGGSTSFTDAPLGLGITIGGPTTIQGGIAWYPSGQNPNQTTTSVFTIYATVTAYTGNTVTVTVNNFTVNPTVQGIIVSENWYVQQGAAVSYVTTWKNQVGSYPSNSDVWWQFKDSTGAFNPSATVNNITLSSPAPKGSVILNAFNQQPTTVTGVPGLGTTATTVRPRTGCWFQGRVWYTGVDAVSTSNGVTNQFYTWTENIYFSQISISSPNNFGNCYQQNDPTSQTLFSLLPTDGGVITIPGSGSIYKLFPIQNGLLVFAANGVWFVTGSQGIGFTATDYTVIKLSQVRSISSTSFVDVLGLPYFWNEEGIYKVEPAQSGSLTVEPITVGTILTFFDNIPYQSRKYVRGAYDPLNYTIQWIYKTTLESGVVNRYYYDGVLTYNTVNKAFYPYTFTNTVPQICSIVYVASPGGTSAPSPTIKFFTTVTSTNQFTFSQEQDNVNYLDFHSYDNVGVNYTSFFVTGYKIRGQNIKRFQPQYIRMISRVNGAESAYTFQANWDYSNQTNSNRWSTIQYVYLTDTRFDFLPRRHRLRGNGYVLQFKVSSIKGQPFDIIGWSAVDSVNQGT